MESTMRHDNELIDSSPSAPYMTISFRDTAEQKKGKVLTMTGSKTRAKAIPKSRPKPQSVRNQKPAKKGDKSKKAAAKRRQAGGIRTAQILGLLKKPGGATLQNLMNATGWQAHSVRGFLSGVVRKKMGLSLRSERREGAQVYSL
jgi:hypothetical protein